MRLKADSRYMAYVSGLCFAMVLALVVISCRNQVQPADKGRKIVVALEGNYLYYDELLNAMSAGLSPEDSATFADEYIKNWISELLLYKNAERNIPDTRDIDRLVDNYRRALIVHQYEQKLIEQKFNSDIPEKEILAFYEENQGLFVLEEPLVKGLCVKLPKSSPNLSRFRSLYQKTDDKSMDELEKYCILNAVRYEPFYDNWMPLSQLEPIFPQMGRTLASLLEQRRDIEVTDDEFVYFLNVTDMVRKGGTEPLERAKPEIRRLLRNNDEVRFIERVKEDLYENALAKNRIEFY